MTTSSSQANEASDESTAAVAGTLWPFRYPALPLRGALVSLGSEWAELVRERGYGETSAALLGQSLCTVALLAGSAKNPPKLTLQLSGAAGVELLVAQSLKPGLLRGMIKPIDLLTMPFHQGGRLVMTLEVPGQEQIAQSIVALDGDNLAVAMQAYFEQSEQLATRFYLFADQTQAFGLMVQRVAGSHDDVSAALGVVEDWALQTLPPEPQKYLGALLENDIELLEPTQSWEINCHCGAANVSRMILGLGADEANDIVAKTGHIEVECGYCGAQYRFDKLQVEQLFRADASLSSDDAPESTLH